MLGLLVGDIADEVDAVPVQFLTPGLLLGDQVFET